MCSELWFGSLGSFGNKCLVLVQFAFILVFSTLNLKKQKRLLWHIFCDRAYKYKRCYTLVCVYSFFFSLENAKGAKTAVGNLMLHINDNLLQEDVVPIPVLDCNGQHCDYNKQKRVLIILSFLGLNLLTLCPIFGSLRCSYFNQTTPEFSWKRTETHLSCIN